MKRRLEQPDSRKIVLPSPDQYRLHQLPANAAILNARFDRDWSDTRDRGSLVETIATHYASIRLGDHAVKARVRKHH